MTDYKAQRSFDALVKDRTVLRDFTPYQKDVEAIVAAIVTALRGGKRIYWCGNGGSAAEAQHMAAELSGRYLRERPGLNSEALSVNTSTLTCIGNDYGYDYIFSRQVDAFVQPGDVLIGMTTSGTSRNVVLALEAGKKKGAITVATVGAR
jgi:D-sedoheptulose 7-phosphate isomerase